MAFVTQPTDGPIEIVITTAVTATTPTAAYNTWAAELGVSNTGTDQALDGDDATFAVTLGSPFFPGQSPSTNLMAYSSEGSMGFSLNTPSSTASASITLTGVSRMFTFTDTPSMLFTFHPEAVDCKSINVKVRTSGNTTIITGSHQIYSGTTNRMNFAAKITPAHVIFISETVDTIVNHKFFGYSPLNVQDNTVNILSQPAATLYQINIDAIAGMLAGNIIETSNITDWRVTILDHTTGTIVSTQTVSGSTYNSSFSTVHPCDIVVAPKIDYKWTANQAVLLNEYVIPSNPETTPHIFKVSTAGTFAGTEASWNLVGTTTQGTAQLTYVAPLIDPKIIGPKIPTPI